MIADGMTCPKWMIYWKVLVLFNATESMGSIVNFVMANNNLTEPSK